MKLKLLSFAAILACGLGPIAHAAEGELVIGTEGAYPPFSMADANGNVTGFDADVGNAVCAKLQLKCRFVVQAFDGLIPALNAKRFDIIISGMSITDERQKQIDFSRSYGEFPNHFIAKKDSELAGAKDLDTLKKDLGGMRVGVQAGTTHAAYVEKNLPDAQLMTYDTLDQMQIDLASGRLDTSFADVTAQNDFLAKPDGADFQLVDVVIDSSSDATLGTGLGIGIRKDEAELKERINQALCDLGADGSMKAASEKWFKMDISQTCK
ncbi:transporter substrate-binding domain-containing protein [Paracoccus litorisediminis]|jgi:octopine/nopaline transport system substrate-binding protein|uniref:Transporter substrate-binding domain-containing protein n=1 Tax=Paracoccus litorisediminis TaxID=2006130 RepID=A0A844HR64_9RHOB|nr:transporter substrate-binding domain-containing protein [Paracoccus litorisediminis]MTH61548.1 transporter substrate-binding domain-containing protein [Paracoccus litorisediminis]